ncbi:hypothetical protein B0J13DRAFT_611731 [Dactylonectria estremocensis]|uniref:Uncharacterized protein n=1 Tax=Dactylonectria estremocensis TaxID=1079267 RepID=A0A9P9DXM7_9HYPO|nr:hypothetical protein B0J13DRAFT_611731 [Dactylonectria estremocensis]
MSPHLDCPCQHLLHVPTSHYVDSSLCARSSASPCVTGLQGTGNSDAVVGTGPWTPPELLTPPPMPLAMPPPHLAQAKPCHAMPCPGLLLPTWKPTQPAPHASLGWNCFAATPAPGHDAVGPRPATTRKMVSEVPGRPVASHLGPRSFFPPPFCSGFWMSGFLDSRGVLQFPSNSVVTTSTEPSAGFHVNHRNLRVAGKG